MIDSFAWIRMMAYLYLGTVILQGAIQMPRVRRAVTLTAGVFYLLACAAFSKMIGRLDINDITAIAMTPYLLLVSLFWILDLWRIGTLRMRNDIR